MYYDMKTLDSHFNSSLDKSYSRIFNFALKLTGNRDDAADLTQDTFVRAYRAKQGRTSELGSDAWFFRIAYHCFLDRRRTASRRPKVVSQELLSTESHAFESADPSPSPEQVFFSGQLSLPMTRAWQALTEQQRSLMVLAHFDLLTHRELSEIFKCGATTIKTRIHRVHLALKQHLATLGHDSSNAR